MRAVWPWVWSSTLLIQAISWRPGLIEGFVDDPPFRAQFRPLQVRFQAQGFIDRRRFGQGDDDDFCFVPFQARQQVLY